MSQKLEEKYVFKIDMAPFTRLYSKRQMFFRKRQLTLGIIVDVETILVLIVIREFWTRHRFVEHMTSFNWLYKSKRMMTLLL